jgi:ketosteroid isomerase-like protein
MASVRLIAVVLVAILQLPTRTPLGRGAPPSKGDSVEQQITALSEQIGQAYMKGDLSILEKYLADDHTAIRANGKVYTKAQEIENVKSGVVKIETDDVRERKIRAYGNTAVVDGLTSATGVSGGKPFSGDFRFTRVWVKQKGEWKSVLYQATRVAPPTQ